LPTPVLLLNQENHMSTLKQQAANRRNAQKSTGPRTPEGKARSATNGLQHGLTALQLVITSESQAEFDAHTAALRADFAPQGAAEELLLEHLIAASWRLRRARNFETLYYSDTVAFLRPHFPLSNSDPELAMHVFCDGPKPIQQTVDKLARYEARLERSFYKALKELQYRQSHRPPAEES